LNLKNGALQKLRLPIWLGSPVKKNGWEVKVFLGNFAGNCSAFAFNSKRKIGTRFFVVFRIEKKNDE
jgi:hypothetical protein